MRNSFHVDSEVLKFYDEENVRFIDVQEGSCKECGSTFPLSLEKSKVLFYGEWQDGCPACNCAKSSYK
jgi:hypothetical protein